MNEADLRYTWEIAVKALRCFERFETPTKYEIEAVKAVDRDVFIAAMHSSPRLTLFLAMVDAS